MPPADQLKIPGSSHPDHPPPLSSTSEETSSKIEDVEQGIDTSVLGELAKRSLIDALNSVNGSKTLILDSTLAGPLGLVTEVALLKQQGVDKMFWLESGPLNAQTTNIVYLCRPQIKWMKMIAEQIKSLAGSTTPHTYTLVLVPRRTTLCDRVLEEEGVFGEITISSYKLEFIPLEDDLISLEWESTFKEIFLDGDETAVYYAAEALITIQQAYGLFPRIMGKGDAAKKLANLMIHLRAHPSDPSQARNSNLSTPSEVIDSLVIVDRSVDMVTPMLTELTYEGLIDEFMGIKNSHVEVDADLLNPPQQSSGQTPGASSSTALPTTTTSAQKKRKHHLTATSDGFFSQLRDANFAVVGLKLSKEARRLDTEFKGRHQAQTVAQLKDFVGKIGGLQSQQQKLKLHTGIAEQISAFTRTDVFNKELEIQQNLLAAYDPAGQVTAIEDLIIQSAPVQIVLRLLCLASITSGGIKAKPLENIKREFLQTYGYDLLPLLLALSSLNLLLPNPLPKSLQAPTFSVSNSLKPPAAPPSFASLRKSLRLLSDTPERSPTDISYVYSGYAPISIRLVQAVAMKNLVLANLSVAAGQEEGEPTTGEALAKREARVERISAHPINGWKGFEESVKLIPGALVDEIQKGSAPQSAPIGQPNRATTTLVFFLGGCTYTEVAALRWMGQHIKGRKFMIATTSMISGTSLLESLALDGLKFPALLSTTL